MAGVDRASAAGAHRLAGMGRRYLVLGLVTALWGTIPVLAGLSDLPAALIVAIRLWTGAICLALVLGADAWRSRRAEHRVLGHRQGVEQNEAQVQGKGGAGAGQGNAPRLLSVQPLRCALTAGVLGAHWLALFAAYQRAPAGTVILVVYLAPLGVAALAPRLLGERLGGRTVAALATATMGFALLAAPAAHSAGAMGLVLSLLASGLFVALIVLSKPLASIYGGLRLAFMELAGAGLMMIPVAVATRWPPPAASWLWVVAIGVVHTALGITLYLNVLAKVPATHIGIMSYLEPVVVVLAAWWWLGQRPTPAMVVGGLLVVGAGIGVAVSAAPLRRRRLGNVVGASAANLVLMERAAMVDPVDSALPSPR